MCAQTTKLSQKAELRFFMHQILFRTTDVMLILSEKFEFRNVLRRLVSPSAWLLVPIFEMQAEPTRKCCARRMYRCSIDTHIITALFAVNHNSEARIDTHFRSICSRLQFQRTTLSLQRKKGVIRQTRTYGLYRLYLSNQKAIIRTTNTVHRQE